MTTRPPAQGPRDKELIKAVKQQCEETGAPVIPTKEVEKVEYIDIQQRSIANRLEGLSDEGKIGSIKVGRGWVWWVPNEGDSGGEVDFDRINWNGIDAEKIPPEKIYAHPEYNDPSRWEQLRDESHVIARVGLWTISLGFVVIITGEFNLPFISFTNLQQDLAALAILFGTLLVLLAVVVGVASKTGEELSEKGIDDWLQSRYADTKQCIFSRIPVSISVEWGRQEHDESEENQSG